MTKKVKVIILIFALIVMFALGYLIPSQFNDKSIVDDNKKSVQKKEEQKKKEKEEKDNLPQNLSAEKFNERFSKESQVGKDFIQKYYQYSFKDPDKSFNDSLNYIDDEYKEEKDLQNDESRNLMYRSVKINKVEPVQNYSDKSKVTFKYDINLDETESKKGFDAQKAKKDEKYLKKVETTKSATNKTITITVSLKDDKIISLKSNYL